MQVEAVSILKFLIFRLIDLDIAVLSFDQEVARGASVAFESFLCARHERTLQGGSPEVQAVAPST